MKKMMMTMKMMIKMMNNAKWTDSTKAPASGESNGIPKG